MDDFCDTLAQETLSEEQLAAYDEGAFGNGYYGGQQCGGLLDNVMLLGDFALFGKCWMNTFSWQPPHQFYLENSSQGLHMSFFCAVCRWTTHTTQIVDKIHIHILCILAKLKSARQCGRLRFHDSFVLPLMGRAQIT